MRKSDKPFKVPSGPIIFKPRFGAIVDAFLFINVFLVLLYPLDFVSKFILGFMSVVLNSSVILFWVLFARHHFRVKIQDETIYGPSAGFKRDSIQLWQIDHIRTRERSSWDKRLSIYNIWSVGGARVRLFRRFIGRGPTNKILYIVENHPYRGQQNNP